MRFDSLAYVGFFLFVLAAYWNLSRRAQNLFLVVASFFFYGFAHAWFLLPFVVTTLIDYLVARKLESAVNGRRLLVGLSVTSNLALLAVFKYSPFILQNVSASLAALQIHFALPVLRILLPAGISFYTFQSIGYVVDVYRRHVPACRSLRDYALFVSFFPQLVAGPIQRAGDLLSQIQRSRTLRAADAYQAVILLLWGFFKKLVIADNVAPIANKVFALQSPSFPILWVGVLAFAVQIYADFSGYTDIARASARLLGFELSRNFDHPYIADSPSDFWRRWHISLSTWIRDYLFIPLGGSRASSSRVMVNLTIVFFLTGLWHGAAWNFILWGLYYAFLTIVYRAIGCSLGAALPDTLLLRIGRIALMFLFTNIGWLIFREHDLHQLGRDFTLSPTAAPASEWLAAKYLLALVSIYASPLALHLIVDTSRNRIFPAFERRPIILSTTYAVAGLLMFVSILFLRTDAPRDFIYFQF